ncbi:unnamed protein product [Acanthosepion pharaonis]|uniref:Uncharacterized protein n=1 Tax=Acanthosepion pharaonis TaxID=158019 RepID=A0A812CGA4_ACAPH|nr:unnamed protein product [Sepia pharaonis]
MSENTPIDQLADAADRIFSQLDHQTTPVHSAEATSDHKSLEKTVEDLQRQVRDLTLPLKAMVEAGSLPAGVSGVDHARPVETRMPLLLCVITTADLGLQHITAPSRVPYQDLLRPAGSIDSTKHQTQHFIKTTGQPVFARPRRLAPNKLKFAKKAFDDMLREGVIRPSDSPYASPLHSTCALKWQTCVIHHRGTARVIYIYRTSSRTASLYLFVTTLLSGLLRRPTGPYRVLKRADKYFQIQKGIHTDNVSIDRLKPAFIEKSSSHTTSQSTPQVQENLKTPVSLDKPNSCTPSDIFLKLLSFSLSCVSFPGRPGPVPV